MRRSGFEQPDNSEQREQKGEQSNVESCFRCIMTDRESLILRQPLRIKAPVGRSGIAVVSKKLGQCEHCQIGGGKRVLCIGGIAFRRGAANAMRLS